MVPASVLVQEGETVMNVASLATIEANSIPEPNSGCWIWLSTLDGDGYAKMKFGGKNRRVARVAYQCTYGDIPAELVIDHLCRVRPCVNPAHLDLVTNRENTMRGETLAALNAAKTQCPQGHEYSWCGKRRYCKTCNRISMRQRRAKLRRL